MAVVSTGQITITDVNDYTYQGTTAPLLSPPLHPINNTPNNQSKPIVPTPSYSLS